MTLSDLSMSWFNVKYFENATTRQSCGHLIESCIWSIKRRHFQWPWTTSNPDFKVTELPSTYYVRTAQLMHDLLR